ncbi:LLM class flavin-dependent oxidoreductase [Paractinoplanes brasiliensis]|uniref:Alkanesulfonate monooxygenase SsuD/methylene tetrahydromethanopterin reductase-like flavin-dependent oxidoreductase (Luciferase family) n=1 Tax=Paractinoplanes brasiliensis TaxID=52695 RepID=A0A4R6JA75_9ACTN|nr:LLM class flavin-dependent oxidoreductase [Actinoplanes brasiliensis]TDO32554.1 alkanesulfonate monooxygenase SsuD/methylene tetrahydromethanopterin reductase-like flavin-dependent oxidoreductase (luciferase family) [Actinoplanes brasiliensis]GID27569.1 N5,N10-methylene tetrahydromethanopterin reductase [Actinoplanes brasiliensis]
MTDYGHDLLFGTFVTPNARALDLAVAADRAGLDLVTFQDHPYQPAFLDTWTLMTYVAARTERIRISGNVLNLPLRPPAVLARAAASLDRLSGGRIELGLGAGAFNDAAVAMGARKLSAGQAIEALAEGIGIIRDLWNTDTRERVEHKGTYYQISGAKRGPAPAHDIGIWVGAYKPKMLALTGRLGDGWLPSLAYLPDGAASLTGMNARIDDAAAEAGRAPGSVRRLLNLGPQDARAEQLAELALTYGISGFIVATDDAATAERLAAEVAPAVRDIVKRERG